MADRTAVFAIHEWIESREGTAYTECGILRCSANMKIVCVLPMFLYAIALSAIAGIENPDAAESYLQKHTPEQFLGGADNVRLVASAEIVSAEQVSIPKVVKVKRWANGHPEFEEIELMGWSGGPLKVEKGPIAVPSELAKRIKSVLQQTWIDDGYRSGCSYVPVYRITLKDPHHVLEILVIDLCDGFEVYLDGARLGGRLPGVKGGDLHDTVSDLNSLFTGAEKRPNEAADRMPGSNTPGESGRH